VPVAKIIAIDGVAIGQALEAGHQPQWVAGQVILAQLPDHLEVGVEFLNL